MPAMPRFRLAACFAALLMAAPPAFAGGEFAGEPMPADGEGASAEAEYVNGDRFGRRDYFQDGNRRGGQFGPGYYQEGYYYPRQQYPDYWQYDARRTNGSVWTFIGQRAIRPLIPTDSDVRAVVEFRARVMAGARHIASEIADETDWAGGRYDGPRAPLK
jgi:hypothetical protein